MASFLLVVGWALWAISTLVVIAGLVVASNLRDRIIALVGIAVHAAFLFTAISKFHVLWITPALIVVSVVAEDRFGPKFRCGTQWGELNITPLTPERKDALRELARQLFDREGVALLWDDPDDGNGIGVTESVNSFSLRAAYRLERLGADERTRAWGDLDGTYEALCDESFKELAGRIEISDRDLDDFRGQFDPHIADYGDPDEDFDYDWPDDPTPEDQLRYNLSYFLQDWFKSEDFDKIIAWDKAQVDAWFAKYGDL